LTHNFYCLATHTHIHMQASPTYPHYHATHYGITQPNKNKTNDR